MKYIRTFETLEEAKEFKKAVLSEKSTVPHRYMIRTLDGGFMTFMDTEWQTNLEPIAFEYEKEAIATKKFMNILFKNKVFGKSRDYGDKNIYIGSTQNKRGFVGAGLKEGDSYIWFGETNGDYMSLITNDNMIIQFDLEKINPVGKTAKGVKGIALAENDYVIEVVVCNPAIDTIKIKRYNKTINNIVVQNRGGKGKKFV